MAANICPECGRRVSVHLIECVGCGHQLLPEEPALAPPPVLPPLPASIVRETPLAPVPPAPAGAGIPSGAWRASRRFRHRAGSAIGKLVLSGAVIISLAALAMVAVVELAGDRHIVSTPKYGIDGAACDIAAAQLELELDRWTTGAVGASLAPEQRRFIAELREVAKLASATVDAALVSKIQAQQRILERSVTAKVVEAYEVPDPLVSAMQELLTAFRRLEDN